MANNGEAKQSLALQVKNASYYVKLLKVHNQNMLYNFITSREMCHSSCLFKKQTAQEG